MVQSRKVNTNFGLVMLSRISLRMMSLSMASPVVRKWLRTLLSP